MAGIYEVALGDKLKCVRCSHVYEYKGGSKDCPLCFGCQIQKYGEPCDHRNNKCIDSRPSKSFAGQRRRRYHCQNCGHRWTTYEIEANKVKQYRTAIYRLQSIKTLATISKW